MVYSPNKYRETEGIKVRRLGYALDAATLQQIAYDHGIQQNINTMTQAQKSQLRYIAIIQQSQNVMGDMARTIMTPANSMRILGQQMTQFQRAVGNVVSVFAVKIIPYIQVAIRLLTDFANWLAELWGFELPTIDYSSVGEGISNLTDDADAASEAVDKTVKAVQRLAGFDEINVLKSAKEDANDTANALSDKFDLGLDLPTYDFLQGVENSTEELYQKAKKWLKELYDWWKKHQNIIKKIGELLAGLWVLNKIRPFIDTIKDVVSWFKTLFDKLKSGYKWIKGIIDKGGIFGKIGVGALFGLTGGAAAYDLVRNLINGTGDWLTYLTDALEIAGSLAAAFALGGPIGLGIAAIGTALGAIVGIMSTINVKDFDEAMTELFDNGGVKLSEITDKFEKQYEAVNKTSEKMSEYVDKLNKNNSKISGARDEIDKLGSSIDIVNGVMTKEKAEKIKKNFEIIAKAIKDNLGLATTGIMESFSDRLSLTAENMGIDLSQVLADIQSFEKSLKGNVDKAQDTINSLTNKMLGGGTLTSEERESYNNAWGYMMDKAREKSGYQDFQQAMSIDFSKIDFESEKQLTENLERLTNAAQNARNSVNSTYDDAIKLLEVDEAEAKRQLDYGLMNYDDYAYMQKSFQNVRKLLAADRNQQISEIEYNYSAITGAMKNQIDNVTKKQAEWLTALEHYSALGLSEIPEKWDEGLAKAIDTFRRSQHKQWDGTIKDGEELWQEWYNSNVSQADKDMHNLGTLLDKYAAQIDIEPNPEAGKLWLQEMTNNSKAELPTTLLEMDYIMGQIRDEIDKEGKTAYMPSKEVEKLVKERYYSLGENQRTEYLRGFDLNGIKQAISNNLGGAGSEAGSSFVNGVYNSGIVNNISGMLNNVGNSGYNAGYNWGNNFAEGAKRQILNQEIEVSWFDSKKNSMYSGSILFQANGYAGGGIVNGDLFYANENGKAEFISSVGNRPAVANQQQMRAEIRQGVKEGMAEALRGERSDNGDIYVFIDSEQVAYSMQRRNAQNAKRTGGR